VSADLSLFGAEMIDSLSPIGLGTWQFSKGKGDLGAFWRDTDDVEICRIVKSSLDRGVNWFDTAEKYGDGAAERALARSLKSLDVDANTVLIADKWWPKQRRARSIVDTIDERLAALGGIPIGLYQIHWPESESWLFNEMKYLARLVEQGKVRHVGLCNYNWRQVKRAHLYLKLRGIKLASVQVRYNLAYRSIEKNNLLKLAQDLDFKIIAWSPLESGLLSGKFHNNKALLTQVKSPRKRMYQLDPSTLRRTQELIAILQAVAEKYKATSAQIALAWLTQRYGTRVLAIPGASTSIQAESNAAAMKVSLSHDDLAHIDSVSLKVCSLQ